MNATRLALALLASLMLAACNTGNVPTFQGWIEAELIFVGPDETGRIQGLAVRQGDRVEGERHQPRDSCISRAQTWMRSKSASIILFSGALNCASNCESEIPALVALL